MGDQKEATCMMPRILLTKLLRGGDNWRHGAWLIVLGLAAYMFAQTYPTWRHLFWHDATPLIWAAGAVVLVGVWYLPNRPFAWLPLKLLIVGAVAHWAIVLPIAFWIERGQLTTP